MSLDLPLIWAGLIAVGVLMYVLLDGFDLGIGILFPFTRSRGDRDVMMNTVAPVWDGNETWLVLGGGGLLAAFPMAYSVVMPALYLPVLLMLVALVFRGVAFEFRFKAGRSKALWGWAFALGSLCTAFWQGVILGAIVQGLPVQDGHAAGGAFAFFGPFPMLTGMAVVCGYALLGAGWLILKTEGRLQQVARTFARPLTLLVVAFMGLVSAWLPFLASRVMTRWFEDGHFWWLSPVPLLVLLNAFALWRAVMAEGRDARPFVLTLCFFGLGFAGLVLGLWPYLVPPTLTLWQAASPPSSQLFVLVGLMLLLPVILGYTWWSYRVFAGKVAADSGYH
jgi:cytochrome d ubiquinol oxidase subunit II